MKYIKCLFVVSLMMGLMSCEKTTTPPQPPTPTSQYFTSIDDFYTNLNGKTIEIYGIEGRDTLFNNEMFLFQMGDYGVVNDSDWGKWNNMIPLDTLSMDYIYSWKVGYTITDTIYPNEESSNDTIVVGYSQTEMVLLDGNTYTNDSLRFSLVFKNNGGYTISHYQRRWIDFLNNGNGDWEWEGIGFSYHYDVENSSLYYFHQNKRVDLPMSIL